MLHFKCFTYGAWIDICAQCDCTTLWTHFIYMYSLCDFQIQSSWLEFCQNYPGGHMTFIQRCINVDATSWRNCWSMLMRRWFNIACPLTFIQRRINVDATSWRNYWSMLMRCCFNVACPLGTSLKTYNKFNTATKQSRHTDSHMSKDFFLNPHLYK